MDMDWEPEIPGQWNSSLHIRHQLVTAEPGFPTTSSHLERPVATDYSTDWEPEIPGQFNTPPRIRRKRTAAEAGFSEAESGTGSHAPNITLQAPVPKSCSVAPITNILGYTFRIFRHIYSAAIRGARIGGSAASAVAGSRQVIEIRKVTAYGFESVKRRVIDLGLMRPVAPTSEQITRDKNAVAQPNSLQSSHRNGETHNMVPSEGSSVSPPLDMSIEQIPPHLEASHGWISPSQRAQLLSPKPQVQEPPVDREALGAKLWASFTPRPIPGSRGILAISQQSAPTPLIDGQQNSSSNIETSVINPLVEKPISPKFHNVLSSKLSSPEKRIKPSLKSLPTEHESRRVSNYTHNGSSLLKRPSLPQLSGSEMRGLPARSNMSSVTPKQVRFAMNETNGLPQEYTVRFYKDSKIGEWAPSSPWADEQLLACTSDLNYNLDALLREDSWLPPPSTPVLNLAEPSYPGEGSSIALEEHHASEPQGTASPSMISPSSTSDSSSISVEIFKDLNHSIGEEQLVEKNPTVQAPAISSVPSSPYTHIRELVKGSFRKVFSPSLQVTPSDRVNKNHTPEAMDISIAYNDTSSQMDELNNSPSLIDSPKISNYTPSDIEGGMDRAPNSNKYKSGLVDSHIEIDGNDGSQYKFVDNGSGGSAGHLRESNGSEDHHITQRKEKDPANAELEHAMKTLKMSTFSTRRLAARRKEQEEAAAAAQKIAEEAAIAKAKAEAEEAERRACSHRRIPKEKLVKPLSEDWEAKIREAMGRGDNAALTTTLTGTELRRKDFITVLGERQWLNDEIINAYIEWVVEYANKKAGKNGRNVIPKVVAHNSFFYKNLSENGPKSVSRWMKRKKAEGKKLLEVETVLIPVNNASHWTIIVVSPKERTIEYLDSFSGASEAFINNTKGWLKEELGSAWQEKDWRVLQTRSAVQNNGYDCGVFCITNAECVAGGVDTASYNGGDMVDQRRRIAGVLLNRGFGGDFVPAEEL